MTRATTLAVVLASTLLLPGLARAEAVPGSQAATDALLAVAPDGSPRVAFVSADSSVQVAARASDGTWSEEQLAGLPGPRALIVGMAVAPGGTTEVLVEDPSGRWLALAEQEAGTWRVRTVAVAPSGASLGLGGLALDASGRPLVAYVVQLRSRKSWLRLVHEDATGRLVNEGVTRDGFPSSLVLPAAAPVVLSSGAVRVVEVYDAAAIEWARTKDRKDWIGQFLYGNPLATPAGVVAAAASGAGVWSAWTELLPNFGESQLLLTLHRNGEHTTVLHRHAYLVALALASSGPEVAGDDYVDLPGGRTAYAGVVVASGGGAVELGGKLVGYGVDAVGGRQYLLLEPGGLSWYRSPVAPQASVTLTATASGAAYALAGSVAGASGGSVELWRETASGAELAATVPLAADGSFSATDTPPAGPLVYRAVYRDPATGLPLASLGRSVLGA